MTHFFDKIVLKIRNKKQIRKNSYLISFSGGQDSIILIFLWTNLFFFCINKKPFLLWCNHLWKKNDFYLFRHSFKISFFFKQKFFYTIFFFKSFNEQKARKFRYFSFLRIAYYSHTQIVLTAHTQDDNIETFFINLFRGSGKFGLHLLRDSQTFINSEGLQKFY